MMQFSKISVETFVLPLLFLLALLRPIHAYGPEGHRIIGAIADQKLANTPGGARLSQLLDGYTLAEASLVADTIKQWDKPGINDPKVQKYFLSHPKIAQQLRDFWSANPPTDDEKSPVPSHHWFHYTDVPLAQPEKYAGGKTGRNQWDIVHTMRYCIAILKGDAPQENARKITQPMAVILLAHLVGDIHQPLHVGAQYFDARGHPVEPQHAGEAFPDEGGNSLRLKLADAIPRKRHPKLHGFWDSDAVLANLAQWPATLPKAERRLKMKAAEKALTDRLTKQEPENWRLPGNVPLEDYPEAWANEILPIARAAHARLRYRHVSPKLEHGKWIADGEVVEGPTPGGVSYRTWSAQVTLEELQKAGWRLADLFQRIFESTAAHREAAAP